MTECNFCKLQKIKATSAERANTKVTIIPEEHEHWARGLNVYVHPVNEHWNSPGYKVAWFAKLPEHCACGGET